MTDATRALAACIHRCRAAQDGRGRWRAELAAAASLGNDSTARLCAAAARRIGEWLAGVKGPAA